jgi:hypothetical protein
MMDDMEADELKLCTAAIPAQELVWEPDKA